MDNNPTPPPEKQERIFFRLPIRVRAKTIFADRPGPDIVIDEISTAGFSFSVKAPVEFPETFEVSFRLPDSLKILRISVEVKDRVSVKDKQRIGCRFSDISDENKERINNYIIQLSDFSIPCVILSIATFLLSIDALCRLFAYLAIMNYARAPFLKGFSATSLSPYYILLLCFYAFICFMALVFSDDMRKRGFMINISCVGFAFIFILAKSILYWKVRMGQSHYLVLNPYSWIQFALLFYTALAIVVGATYLKRVVTVSDALQAHRRTTQ
ncbi:MAG: PilZ domain-containing protein [Candidatus Omnitrophica bacterium]|nr:PilZ domain-containing protein [Candidatus Omnitrophota bacterium]